MWFHLEEQDGEIILTGGYGPNDKELYDIIPGLIDGLEPLLDPQDHQAIIAYHKNQDVSLPDITKVSRFLFFIRIFVTVYVHYQHAYIFGPDDEDDEKPVAGFETLVVDNFRSNRKYSSRGNFYSALDRLTGKVELNKEVLSSILERLSHYFVTHSDDRNIPGLFRALKEVRLPYYDSARILAFHLWGIPLLNIKGFEDTIDKIYNYTQVRFLDIRIKESRKSNINLPYRLYKTLKLSGITVRDTDFKLPSTKRSLQTNKQMWKSMIKGFKFSDH